MKTWIAHAGWIIAAGCFALVCQSHASEPLQLTARGTAQVAFTPGDDAASLVLEALRRAKRQVLVQAYSLTHKDIAEALVDARRRGLDVQVIADPEQHARGATSLVAWLAEQGVPVWFDGEHAAAHNKVMVIDTGTASAAVLTGSFNFTHAAQYRNAENLLLLKGNPELAAAYAANWRRHRIHSLPYRAGR
ncbi:MAG: endonuclease [Hydrogenophilales bacterium CG17_big_fil_post_rev_8_21_14_2_50_63_12]|nr:MAG: endonuclease [Hydrogenophilales bacterium CG17_big_fil_post_rev_8_21_14_2_50_63_12]PIX97912.1 MAG: endonuclease [Hydrogenophilales bacterium CG_4_10_14_3_um_filter_63_21]PJB03194.1 MAG: endonuclease [Hydrogenophilales bacterium CG_4_9_14_3_um_filter_63_34]